MSMFSRQGKEFLEQTKQKLRERVAYMCSNPLCRRLTVKAETGNDGIVRQGKAAHIHSAGNVGPRSNPTMTNEECRSFSNGVWLCDICARLVDDDEAAYPPELLRKWRMSSEAYVAELVTQDSRLRQLRLILMELLSSVRILTAAPGPGPVLDQTFRDAGHIPLGRIFIETEQILFENEFIDEANTVARIGKELIRGIIPRIGTHRPKECTDISQWKNEAVRSLMVDTMRFKEEAYQRYLSIEQEMVNQHHREVIACGITVLTL